MCAWVHAFMCLAARCEPLVLAGACQRARLLPAAVHVLAGRNARHWGVCFAPRCPARAPPPARASQVVLEEGAGRKVIFSTFDPDCATLLSLKQPRFPVLFLTCGGTKVFTDPRMNSLEAALQFALASQLQVGGRLGSPGRVCM